MSRPARHTRGIVLSRTNYAESDRILTILTRDFGKVRLIAKGVRNQHSKLAGGIELFSVSEVGFVDGRGELAILVSSRLIKHFGSFLGDLDKVDFAYLCLKSINHITADAADSAYFRLLEQLLSTLDRPDLSLPIISTWWYISLAELTGHKINTVHPIGSKFFAEDQRYVFDSGHGGFISQAGGDISPSHIKFLRLAANQDPQLLIKVRGGDLLAENLVPYLKGFIDFVH